MKKRWFALVLAVVMAASGQVYYLNFKPEQDQQWQDLAAKYTAATGVQVKVVTAAEGTYEQTLTSEMAKRLRPDSVPGQRPCRSGHLEGLLL
jgi:ABC-type glycerol-3-phosphate transport system substrate-binding protein